MMQRGKIFIQSSADVLTHEIQLMLNTILNEDIFLFSVVLRRNRNNE